MQLMNNPASKSRIIMSSCENAPYSSNVAPFVELEAVKHGCNLIVKRKYHAL